MTEQDSTRADDGNPFVPDSAVCPICHNTIRLADESFLELCYHRFCFHCIRKWTDTQAELHKSSRCGSLRPSFSCPLCKGIYSYILHDVLDTHSFRQHFVPGGSGSAPGSRGGNSDVYVLDSAQRRRRGLYFAPPSMVEPDDTTAALRVEAPSPSPELPNDGLPSALSPRPDADAACTDGGGRKVRKVRMGPAALRTHQEAWLKRELQALLLQEDVGLVLSHVLASADEGSAAAHQASIIKRSTIGGRGRLALPSAAANNININCSKRPRIDAAQQQQHQGVHQNKGGEQQVGSSSSISSSSSRGEEALVRAVERTIRPFLVDDRQARLLAAEFAAFCGSGLPVADYDAAEERRCRHRQQQEQQRQQQQILLEGTSSGDEGTAEAEGSARAEEGGVQEEEEEEGIRVEAEASAAAAGAAGDKCGREPPVVDAVRDVVAYLSDEGADLPETDDGDDDDASPGDLWSSGDER